jgi:cupin superfamily acireductone dioxygenase involved in methionine salvage
MSDITEDIARFQEALEDFHAAIRDMTWEIRWIVDGEMLAWLRGDDIDYVLINGEWTCVNGSPGG